MSGSVRLALPVPRFFLDRGSQIMAYWGHIELALRSADRWLRGARLLATNPDNWCPVSSDKTRPGAGATAAFLEASTGRRAYYLGKPNGYMFHRARRKRHHDVGEMHIGG